jgi:hypothetical protein
MQTISVGIHLRNQRGIVKGTGTNACAHRECKWGSRGTAPRILRLGFKRRSVASFTPQPTYPQRYKPRYPLNRGPSRPQRRVWKSGGNEVLVPAAKRNMDPPAHTLVTTSTAICYGARSLHLTHSKLVSGIQFWARERAVSHIKPRPGLSHINP